jgi:hypothetical protein
MVSPYRAGAGSQAGSSREESSESQGHTELQAEEPGRGGEPSPVPALHDSHM